MSLSIASVRSSGMCIPLWSGYYLPCPGWRLTLDHDSRRAHAAGQNDRNPDRRAAGSERNLRFAFAWFQEIAGDHRSNPHLVWIVTMLRIVVIGSAHDKSEHLGTAVSVRHGDSFRAGLLLPRHGRRLTLGNDGARAQFSSGHDRNPKRCRTRPQRNPRRALAIF